MYEIKRVNQKYAGVIDMFQNDAFLDRQRIMILENDMIFTKQEIDKHYYSNPNKRKIVHLDKIYGDNKVETQPRKIRESLLLVKKASVQPSLILIPNQPTVTLIPNQSNEISMPNQPIVPLMHNRTIMPMIRNQQIMSLVTNQQIVQNQHIMPIMPKQQFMPLVPNQPIMTSKPNKQVKPLLKNYIS